MTRVELLANIKASLRASTTAYDTVEITPLINEALKDITTSMEWAADITEAELLADEMVCGAIRTYVKSRFGTSDDMERYELSYQTQLAKLAVRTNAEQYIELD